MNTQVAEQNNQGTLQSYNDNMIMDVAAMQHMMQVATFMSNGTATLPAPYQKNPANCLAVVMQAAQWKMNPFAVAQKTHFVNGTIGYEAQLVSAVIQQSGAVKGMFEFEWFGDWAKVIGKFKEVESKTKKDDYDRPKKFKVPAWDFKDEEGLGIRVSATLKGESTPRILELLLTQATTRNSTLWADDPKQQIAYLAQKRWARLYAPGVILGVYTADELDTIPREIDVTPATSQSAEPSITYLSDEEFEQKKAAWKTRWLRGKAAGSTIDGFKNWAQDNSGKALTNQQVEIILAWEPDAPKPTTIEGQSTPVSATNSDFVAEMNAAEQANSQA